VREGRELAFLFIHSTTHLIIRPHSAGQLYAEYHHQTAKILGMHTHTHTQKEKVWLKISSETIGQKEGVDNQT